MKDKIQENFDFDSTMEFLAERAIKNDGVIDIKEEEKEIIVIKLLKSFYEIEVLGYIEEALFDINFIEEAYKFLIKKKTSGQEFSDFFHTKMIDALYELCEFEISEYISYKINKIEEYSQELKYVGDSDYEYDRSRDSDA